MKTKLEINKWYRSNGYLVLLEKKIEGDYTFSFKCFADGKLRGGIAVFDRLEPLETLTPSEALILLGKSFELVSDEFYLILDIESGRFMAKEKYNLPYEFKEILDFNGFTIHALPDEAENG